jgi:hypothetical protein
MDLGLSSLFLNRALTVGLILSLVSIMSAYTLALILKSVELGYVGSDLNSGSIPEQTVKVCGTNFRR